MIRLSFLLLFAWLPLLRAEKITLVIGGGAETNSANPAAIKLNGPFGVDFDRKDNIFVVEMNGNRILRWDAKEKTIATIAGLGGEKGFGGDEGPALNAQFNGPHSIALGPNGDLYVADTWNNRVRKIDAKELRISTVAGTGKKGFSGDGGPAREAEFGGIYCTAFDFHRQNLYVADLDNRRIRKINLKSGIVQTVAGNGQKGVPTDGAVATNSPLVDPRAIAMDPTGVLFILERSGHALRYVTPDGRIATLVGTGEKGFSGDDSDPRAAKLNGPKHLCIDREGSVIIADTENHVIRKYIPRERRIVRVAGTGTKGSKGTGGSPLEAELSQPHGVAVDSTGALYIADSSNDRVLKIEK
jgi:DNA-binding beta-propeller fold protein YncE